MSIFAGAPISDGYTSGVNDSTLLNSTSKIRSALFSRNLYNPDRQYPLAPDQTDKIINSINTIIGTLAPFKSYNLKNTVYGRLITNPTPLTEIGLIMLGNQFALNSASHIAQKTFPVINVSNLFDGNKDTKLFTLKKEMKITKKSDDTTFENFLDKVVYYYPSSDNPFNKNSQNSDYIKNTGLGQLSILYQEINQNIYKQNDTTLYDYANKADTQIKDRRTTLEERNKIYFDFFNKKFNPYISILPKNINSINIANDNMLRSYDITSTDDDSLQEYAPNSNFIENNFGKTNLVEKNSIDNWVGSEDEFSGDNINDKLIWGRDGVNENAEKNISKLRGNTINEENVTDQSINSFKIRTGLLEYTRNLLNATDGNIIDITKKVFKNGEKIVGFNGSPLFTSNNSKYANNSGIGGKSGIRQHSAIDQYDRFAKAIRFNGNIVYGGNPESVVYKTVLPKIHPTINNENFIDNKNLMFSIENLAVGAFKSNDGYGITDDEEGTPIPLSEVGAFNGRVMWFPPYNLQIQENSVAKYESTVTVGRNEPMYSYMNSERSGTLSFTLLVDYPEHLRNYTGQNKQKEIADFFAFGGDTYRSTSIDSVELKNLLIKEQELKLDIENIEGKKEAAVQRTDVPSSIQMSFPNDVPKFEDNLRTIVDKMYIDYHYEITENCFSSDGTGYGINKKIYFITGLTKVGDTYILNNPTITGGSFSQYNQAGIDDQFGECILNKTLKDLFDNEDNRKLFKIIVSGGASKLYTELNNKDTAEEEEYNRLLGIRRANAAFWLVDSRLKAIFGKESKDLGITIELGGDDGTGTFGSQKASLDNATKVAISKENTKNERIATIEFKRTSAELTTKKTQTSNVEDKIVSDKKNDLEKLQGEINKLKRKTNPSLFNERTMADKDGIGDTGILKGFQSVSGNYFYPVFHSQTPEDFHRRLTFLQQCLRQGAAKRYCEVDSNNELRAKNSVFGRQPFCILRIGDFFYTKIIIESLNIDYNDTIWDTNPEGFGLQPMIANITLNIKILGGQSLKGPIDALQNAVSYNYYANSTYLTTPDSGIYKKTKDTADKQGSYINGVLSTKSNTLLNDYEKNPNRYNK
jgi:hypothetical protein